MIVTKGQTMTVNRSKPDQYQLRFPPGLRDELRADAEIRGRSMNAEILARLEEYPKLQLLQPRVSYLEMENQQLKEELEKQRSVSAQLQHLLSENFEDEKRRDENDREASEAIEKRFNELMQQTEYLETLKAELLELSKEREGINEDLVKHQREALELLVQSHRIATTTLRNLAKTPTPEMIGTTLTPELFDKLFKQLVRVEQKLGGSEEE